MVQVATLHLQFWDHPHPYPHPLMRQLSSAAWNPLQERRIPHFNEVISTASDVTHALDVDGSSVVRYEGLRQENDLKMSELQCIVTIMKCAVGGGSFVLPYAFLQGGVAASAVSIVFLGVMTTYTVHTLLLCEHRVSSSALSGSEHVRRGDIHYADIGAYAFPGCILPFSVFKNRNFVEIFIYSGVVLTCIGVCSAYLNFIVSILVHLFSAAGKQYDTLQRPIIVICLLPLMLGLAVLKSFRILIFSSFLGDLAVISGIIAVLVYGTGVYAPQDLSVENHLFNYETFPLFFGNAAFLFSIHVCMIPISQNTKDNTRVMPRVLKIAFGCITAVNGLFGCIGYILYSGESCEVDDSSDSICRNIIDNIEENSFAFVLVKLLLCIDLFFTIPVILTAAHQIIEKMTKSLIVAYGGEHYKWQCCRASTLLGFSHESIILLLMRFFLVFVVVGVSICLSEFGVLVDIVGGVLNSVMGYILPPLLYLKLFRESLGLLEYGINICIICYGIFIAIFTLLSF